MNNANTYYVVCPICGYKLLKAANGAYIEIYCPKCKTKLEIAVNRDGVTIQKSIADGKSDN